MATEMKFISTKVFNYYLLLYKRKLVFHHNFYGMEHVSFQGQTETTAEMELIYKGLQSDNLLTRK